MCKGRIFNFFTTGREILLQADLLITSLHIEN
jgi:hypothetical protein